MRSSLAPCLVALSLLLLATPAAAGPVSQVARGVENKVETHSNPPASPSPPDPPRTPDPPSYDDDSSHIGVGYGQPTGYYEAGGRAYYMIPPCGEDCGPVRVYGGGMRSDDSVRGELLPGPIQLHLYAGAHSVVGSQGALVGEVRVSKAWIGLSASGTSYFERVEGEDKRGDQTVRLDLMAFALNGRIAANGPSEMWIDVGLAATTSSEYDAVLGAMAGLRFEHQLGPELGVAAQGRMYRLESDVSAVEGWAGVRAWFVRAGYRALRFNVGPALHGPEAGVAFEF
jgi:hypothetical protein